MAGLWLVSYLVEGQDGIRGHLNLQVTRDIQPGTGFPAIFLLFSFSQVWKHQRVESENWNIVDVCTYFTLSWQRYFEEGWKGIFFSSLSIL